MKIATTFLFLITFCITSSYSQQFAGVNSSAYAGLYSINQNPANIIDNKLKFELQFASAIVPYQGINFLFIEEPITFNDIENNVLNENINAMVRAMSFAFQFGKRKHSISVTADARANLTVKNLNSDVASILASRHILNDFENVTISNINLNYLSNAWTETGLSYGLVLLSQGPHYVKASARIKLLHSISTTYINSSSNDITPTGGELIGINNLNTEFAFATLDDVGNFNFGDFDTSYDFGFVYNWRPNKHYADEDAKYRYKLSIGLAIVDLGKISVSKQSAEQLSGSLISDENFEVSVSDLNGSSSIKELLLSNSNITDTDNSRTYNLPNRIIVQADFQLHKAIFIHAFLDTGNENDEEFQLHTSSYFQVTPRIESQKLGLYVPLTFTDDIQLGLGARIGPLAVSVQDLPALLSNTNEFSNNLVSVGLRWAIKKSASE